MLIHYLLRHIRYEEATYDPHPVERLHQSPSGSCIVTRDPFVLCYHGYENARCELPGHVPSPQNGGMYVGLPLPPRTSRYLLA